MQKKQIGLILFLIIIFISPFLVSSQENSGLTQPKTIEESKNFFVKAAQVLIEKMPSSIKEIWRNQVLPTWQKMWNWFSDFWKNYIGDKLNEFWYSFLKPKINLLLNKFRVLLNQKIEKEKPIIEKELQGKKEIIDKNISTNTQSYIEKFKELIK
jgi:hypothetical protein